MTADPGLELLTGSDAEALLRGVLGDLTGWRVRQVDHRPGSGTTVLYDATVQGPDGAVRQLVGGSIGRDGAPQLWRFPLDPDLPALARAADEQAVREVLTSLGIRPGPVRLDVRSYRPGRRAVVEVRSPGSRVFLKVVRPRHVEALHERHRLLRAAGLPVPRSLGWSADGLLVLEALVGRSMRTALRTGSPVPGTHAVVQLLDRLPQEVCELPRRPAWTDSVAHYAAVTAAVLPGQGERCARLAERVRSLAGDRPADEPSHGDLYDGQLLVGDTAVTGLLDVDTVGPGRRVDDCACVLAHLEVLAQDRPEVRAVARQWHEHLRRGHDPAELRARVAGVLVALATGPYRVHAERRQEQTVARLELAERWLTEKGRTASVASRG